MKMILKIMVFFLFLSLLTFIFFLFHTSIKDHTESWIESVVRGTMFTYVSKITEINLLGDQVFYYS